MFNCIFICRVTYCRNPAKRCQKNQPENFQIYIWNIDYYYLNTKCYIHQPNRPVFSISQTQLRSKKETGFTDASNRSLFARLDLPLIPLKYCGTIFIHLVDFQTDGSAHIFKLDLQFTEWTGRRILMFSSLIYIMNIINDNIKFSDLARAGMSIARLNFSHATHEFAQEIVNNIQKARELTKKNIAILGDLRVSRYFRKIFPFMQKFRWRTITDIYSCRTLKFVWATLKMALQR